MQTSQTGSKIQYKPQDNQTLLLTSTGCSTTLKVVWFYCSTIIFLLMSF